MASLVHRGVINRRRSNVKAADHQYAEYEKHGGILEQCHLPISRYHRWLLLFQVYRYFCAECQEDGYFLEGVYRALLPNAGSYVPYGQLALYLQCLCHLHQRALQVENLQKYTAFCDNSRQCGRSGGDLLLHRKVPSAVLFCEFALLWEWHGACHYVCFDYSGIRISGTFQKNECLWLIFIIDFIHHFA